MKDPSNDNVVASLRADCGKTAEHASKAHQSLSSIRVVVERYPCLSVVIRAGAPMPGPRKHTIKPFNRDNSGSKGREIQRVADCCRFGGTLGVLQAPPKIGCLRSDHLQHVSSIASGQQTATAAATTRR